jgi:iodotyrosine deiodinase
MTDKMPLNFQRLTETEMIEKSNFFLKNISSRRTVRDFSNEEVPEEVILNAVKSAATAPNGANLQPWHFVIIKNKKVKSELREKAEKIESGFYSHKAPQEWLDDLKHLGTNSSKPFLAEAPYIIVVFEKKYDIKNDGTKKKLYYTKESVGIATGILITALHSSGLATLTYTPENMLFLNDFLNRPKNEKPFLQVVTGYPKTDADVPVITKKKFDDIAEII